MKINSQIIFLIAIVGIIAAGVVGATLLNNGSMKQTDFDGIKVNVPSDSNFVKTADGYADSKYGITIHTFKNNNSMVNFLKGVSGASVISLKNQPPQSVAFVQGDNTNVLLTNGVEGISIGAKDQGLVSDMSNSVVFSNHQKSVKPKVSVPGIAPPPHLEFNYDFNKIKALMLQVNTDVFNVAIFEQNINQSINDYNVAVDNNVLDQYTANEFAPVQTTDSAVVNNNAQQQNTSLLDTPQASSVVQSFSSDSGNAAGGDAASNNANPSSTPSISADNPSSVSSSAADSSSGNNNQQQKITMSDFENALKESFHNGEKIVDIDESGDYYIVKVKYSDGKTEKLKFDAFTGQFVEKLKS
jgi:hypothetical protein